MKVRCDLSVFCYYNFTHDDGYGLKMQAYHYPIISRETNKEYNVWRYGFQHYFIRQVYFDFEDIFGFASVTPFNEQYYITGCRLN